MKTLLKSFLLIFFVVATTSCSTLKFNEFYGNEESEESLEIFKDETLKIDDYEADISSIEQEAMETSESRNTIKIAILVPLSGEHEKVGQILLKSAEMAVFDLHRKNLVLMPFDTKGTPFGAKEAIKQAVMEGVSVVVGPLFTSETKEVVEIASANGIRVLSFSNNEELVNSGAYLMGFSPEQEIERLVTYAIDQGKIDFVAFLPNNKYGASISKILKETVSGKDGKVIRIEYYSPSAKNLSKQINRIKDSYGIKERVYEEYEAAKQAAIEIGSTEEVQFIVEEEDRIYPEVVLIPEAGKKLDTIVEALGKTNKNGIPYQYIGTSQWDTYSTYSNNNLVNSWFTSGDPYNYNEFENNFYKTYRTVPLRIASLAYDAINIIDEITNGEGDLFVTNDTLTRYKGFKGIDGKLRFLPNGLVERQFTVIRVDNGGLQVLDSPNRMFMIY